MTKEKLEELKKQYEELSEDEEMQRLAYLREKGRRERSAIYDKGLDDGIEKGKEEGIKEGIKRNARETAKKLKEAGVDISIIINSTGLTKEEIEKL